MKVIKTFFVSLVLGLGIVLVLSSCSSKDEEPMIPGAESVAGTYKGYMTCSVMGEESVFENMVFKIDASDNSTVDIDIPSFGNPPMLVAGFVISGVKVSGDNGSYSLASTEFAQESNGKKISGTIQGRSVGEDISINFTLNYGAMPMPMICSFDASKL